MAQEINAKAYVVIDDCVKQLRKLGGGEIPTRWSQYFINGAKTIQKKKCNGLHYLIAAEYLIESGRNNPAILGPNLDVLISIPDEEPVPHGTLQMLANRYGMHHSSIREIVNKMLESDLLEVQSSAIFLSWED